ncbi:hypothetical protein [Bacillus toyonensis]|uniref:hypothetical protein n=1 Tax=Bacillus toyonensis TaxID=155322 RepID=UPI0015D4A7D7|nr:hypothetical protein [Bacillus toyonensis]
MKRIGQSAACAPLRGVGVQRLSKANQIPAVVSVLVSRVGASVSKSRERETVKI